MNGSSADLTTQKKRNRTIIFDLLMILVLLAGAYLRFVGLNWGEYTFMHPDERFLVWVTADIAPVNSLSEYFDTPNSTLNPNNRGHGFYVYGDLPILITRYLADWIYQSPGWEQIQNVGRPISALSDLLIVGLVYLAASRLYNRRVGLLAAIFYALAVLPIQLSHYYKEDTLANFFNFLAIYFAVRVMTSGERGQQTAERNGGARYPTMRESGAAEGQAPGETVSLSSKYSLEDTAPSFRIAQFEPSSIAGASPSAQNPSRFTDLVSRFIRNPDFIYSIAFGIALGCAVASKLNAAPVAVMLPAAFALRMMTLPREQRERRAGEAFGYVATAAVISLLVFRIFQPYAFSGPGFFGMTPNPQWVANIQEQRVQASGDVDFPPALQWARRPIWFAGQNLVEWGLGLPLGLLSFAGFLWAGWRILKGEWQRHTLLWGWTAFYFAWQSTSFNPTMRYLLPIYPTLAVFGGWAVVELYDLGRKMNDERRRTEDGGRKPDEVIPSSSVVRPSSSARNRWSRVLAVVIGAAVILTTAAWAFAFTRIYTRPFTRAEASRWVYQNLPGPINLRIQTAQGTYNQPLPYPSQNTIRPDQPYITSIDARASGTISEITLGHLVDIQPASEPTNLTAALSTQPDGSQPIASGTLAIPGKANAAPGLNSAASSNPAGQPVQVPFQQTADLIQGQTYTLILSIPSGQKPVDICGQLTLHIQVPGSVVDQALMSPAQCIVRDNAPQAISFSAPATGQVNQVDLAHASNLQMDSTPKTVTVAVSSPKTPQVTATASLTADLSPQGDPRGQGYLLKLDKPFPVTKGDTIGLAFSLQSPSNQGALTFVGASPANESSWDDAIPLRIDGYDGYGGIYPGDLNFEMYWDDTPDKLARFENILDKADAIFITSNRQWATTTRVPERYPLTTEYYRQLLGCPEDISVISCYEGAETGMYHGTLGFDLVKVIDSYPTLGPIQINDQSAEEAFTVYDHPKVFIFLKSKSYDPQKVHTILGSVDLTQVVHVTPRKAGSFPANLMLPIYRWNQQVSGGTWSQLFDIHALQNRIQSLSVVFWYLSLLVLAWLVYPLLRIALPGLSDRGYPLARTTGLLLLSYLVWLAGSFRIPFSQLTISLAVVLIAATGLILAWQQRAELRQEWRERKGYFLVVEGLFLSFFLFDLLIRYGNPDLWHPFTGGEKPMDFAFFNAVLKSTTFPPYDPWFAGGYMNYYYYGFVFVGVLVKLLGIVPAIAYNIIEPTIFSMVAMGAFCVVWNLVDRRGTEDEGRMYDEGRRTKDGRPSSLVVRPSSFVPALAGALSMAVLGNLATVRMIFQGYEKLAAPGGIIESADLLTRWGWAFQGFLKALGGATLPYAIEQWYWNPTRIFPPGDNAFAEFPFFTVLYGDPHAHWFALPMTLLVLAFALSVVLARGRWKGWLGTAAGFFLGGLAIGALRPTNTWDFYPYLPLASVAVGYGLWRSFSCRDSRPVSVRSFPIWQSLPETSRRLLVLAGGILLLAVLSLVLYQPYAQWYGQGYNKLALWTGTRTPIDIYLTHWGLFLFTIVSWMAWETRDWLASTPVSSLRKLEPYKFLIEAGLVLLVGAVLALLLYGVPIAWIALPLAAWAGVLIFRPKQTDARRFVLFLIGTGFMVTLMVEIIVLVGDVGRMNTVFKFYYQVWTMFAISAAAGFGWILEDLSLWRPVWRNIWQFAMALLVFSASLYPLLAATAKVKDRMAVQAPHTLDGMAYMAYAQYQVDGKPMALDQDYQAIQWMQENVKGSPVIVEANLRNLYQWGSRFSNYTGLPGVVGWEWHEQQQRALLPPDWVSNRIAEIDNFYQTTDLQQARDFLRKYDVGYIIVGLEEQLHYPGPGLDKFSAANGVLWREVYHQGDTAIYQVIK